MIVQQKPLSMGFLTPKTFSPMGAVSEEMALILEKTQSSLIVR